MVLKRKALDVPAEAPSEPTLQNTRHEEQAARLKQRLMQHSQKQCEDRKARLDSKAAELKERLMEHSRRKAAQRQQEREEQRRMRGYRAEDMEWVPQGDMEWPTVENIQGRATDRYHWGVPPVHRWHPPLILMLSPCHSCEHSSVGPSRFYRHRVIEFIEFIDFIDFIVEWSSIRRTGMFWRLPFFRIFFCGRPLCDIHSCVVS